MKKIRIIKENDLFDWKVGDEYEIISADTVGGYDYVNVYHINGGPIHLQVTALITRGYAEYREGIEGIGDMGEGYSVECTLPYSTKILNAPFSIDAVALFIDATLRLMKIVNDCNEGKEWEEVSRVHHSVWKSPYKVYLVDGGDLDVGAYVSRESGIEWYAFKSKEDAEWSMKEHKDLWEIFFKGLSK